MAAGKVLTYALCEGAFGSVSSCWVSHRKGKRTEFPSLDADLENVILIGKNNSVHLFLIKFESHNLVF